VLSTRKGEHLVSLDQLPCYLIFTMKQSKGFLERQVSAWRESRSAVDSNEAELRKGVLNNAFILAI